MVDIKIRNGVGPDNALADALEREVSEQGIASNQSFEPAAKNLFGPGWQKQSVAGEAAT